MNEARTASDKFEARLVGFKKESRKDGDWIQVTFHIHPDNITPALNNAPLKTRFMVVAVPFVDEPNNGTAEKPEPANDNCKPVKPRTEPGKPSRQWSDVPIVQQCGIACNDPEFIDWLYKNCGLDYVDSYGMSNSDWAAETIRRYCGVQSRKELATNTVAADKFRKLYQEFKARNMTEER